MKFMWPLLIMLIVPSPCFGSYETVLKMAQEYTAHKKEVVSFEKEKRDLLGKIYELEKRTRRIVKEKSKFSRESLVYDEDIKNISRSIISLENELKVLTRQIMSRLIQTQKISNMPWMYVFISSYSPSELERMIKTFKNLNRTEAKMIREYVTKVDVFNREKNKLHEFAKNLILANKGVVKKEMELKNQQKKRKLLLQDLNRKIVRTKSKIKKTRSLGQKIADRERLDDLKLLFESSFFEKKGRLKHPIDGVVSHEFGLNKWLLRDNVKLLHKGLFYSANVGKNVEAIGLGRIKFAARVPSMGLTVIIDHGSHYYSVYSNLKKVLVKKGEMVLPKKVLGESGFYNAQFGPGLYFEIRHFSEPENPENWLRKKVSKNKLAKN